MYFDMHTVNPYLRTARQSVLSADIPLEIATVFY